MTLPSADHWLWPDWQHHPRVGSCVTTRAGDWSPSPWQGFNLGLNCGDDPARVLPARKQVADSLGMPVAWLTQVHGTGLVRAASGEPVEADGVFCHHPGMACAVLTADCLPVLMARRDAQAVAAVHAGWRGLQAGILERAARQLAPHGEALDIWVGPGICQRCYQVSGDVYHAFVDASPAAQSCFIREDEHHWRCDLSGLAVLRLAEAGHDTVQQSGLCTVCDNDHFYSHRHEGRTGRFASLIWLKET